MYDIGNKTEKTELRKVTANDVKAYDKAMKELNRLKKITDAMKADLIHEVKTFGKVDKDNPDKMTLAIGKTLVTVTNVKNVRFCESDFKADNPEQWEEYRKPNPYDKVTTNV